MKEADFPNLASTVPGTHPHFSDSTWHDCLRFKERNYYPLQFLIKERQTHIAKQEVLWEMWCLNFRIWCSITIISKKVVIFVLCFIKNCEDGGHQGSKTQQGWCTDELTETEGPRQHTQSTDRFGPDGVLVLREVDTTPPSLSQGLSLTDNCWQTKKLLESH